jgi:hypothetical protein
VLARDAPVVLDERVERLGHVEHLGGAVDLHERPVELVRQHQHGDVGIAPGVAGLGALGVGRDHDPPAIVEAARDRGRLWAPVGAGRDEHRPVPRAHEVGEAGPIDPGVRRDLPRHPFTLLVPGTAMGAVPPRRGVNAAGPVAAGARTGVQGRR